MPRRRRNQLTELWKSIPLPQPFAEDAVNGNAIVAGYPHGIFDNIRRHLVANDCKLYSDSGPIHKVVNYRDTSVIQYGQLDIVTSVGQSGGPLLV